MRALVIGCAVLLVVGCAGVRSEAPQEEQGRAEATKEQTHSVGAASEEARCEGMRTFKQWGMVFTTNDLPGCPKGGLLEGTDKSDPLDGKHGDDEVRGLGAEDYLIGGAGDDVLYGGDGGDGLLAGNGEDLMYGGDSNDHLNGGDEQRDQLYCGKGEDTYSADKNDHVGSSCEKKIPLGGEA